MDQNKSLWSAILDDIAKESTMPESTLFLLGDMGVGKKTLMKALGCQRKKKDQENKTPLICAYQAIPLIHPKAPSSSPIGPDVNLNIYSISHQSLRSQLLFYINDSTIHNSIIAIVIDLTKSVEVIQKSIESWMDHLDKQFNVSEEQLNIAKQNIVEYLKNYKEPTEDDENDIIVNRLNQSIVNVLETPIATPTTPLKQQQNQQQDGMNKDEYPSTPSNDTNDDNSSFENCGIPIVFICTHCESVGIPQKSKIVSNYLRSAAYRYRAAVCYTSIQESSNMNLLQLQTYLYHRFYPNIFNYHYRGRNDIKNIFIPSGWDNEDKLNTLRLEIEENARTPTPLTPADNSTRRDEDDYILDPDCFIDSLFKDTKVASSTTTTVGKKTISVAANTNKDRIASFYDNLRNKKKATKGGVNKTPTTPKESTFDTP